MTAVAVKSYPVPDVSEAGRLLGKLGGRPKGSYSSPLARWLRAEVKQRQAEGYRCREAFEILRDSEEPNDKDAFTVRDWTVDAHDLDIGARVTWNYWRRLWQSA